MDSKGGRKKSRVARLKTYPFETRRTDLSTQRTYNYREMDYTDSGLGLHRVSDAAGLSIKQAVFTFRATHSLHDEASHIRAYGVSGGYLDVWIGSPPSPTYGEPYSILDD